jgi:hypothetical protein
MKSIVKLFGISTCCLVGGIIAANAEPTLLADADLDGVTAGSCSGIPNCVDPPLGGFQRPGLLFSPLSRLSPAEPAEPDPFPQVGPDPDQPIPVEGGRCWTGGCPNLSLFDNPVDPSTVREVPSFGPPPPLFVLLP